MKTVVFSVVFAVLASGCAMGADGPEDCTGSCNQATFELSASDSVKLAGTWTAADGKQSMNLSENGYCQLDDVPCTYTVRATAPKGEYTFPWFVDLQLANGERKSFEVEFIDTNAFTAKEGEGFVDFVKNGGAVVPRKANIKPQQASDTNYDAIQPFGRSHH